MTRNEIESMNFIRSWQKEKLFNLLKKYPEIEMATREQLEKFKQEKYRKAQGLIKEAGRIEIEAEKVEVEADMIQLYLDLTEDK
mgnify:CR=1 FL=1